jgi:hypothetical protein
MPEMKFDKIVIYGPVKTLKSGLYSELKKEAPDIVTLVPIELLKNFNQIKVDKKLSDRLDVEDGATHMYRDKTYMIVFDDMATVDDKNIIKNVNSYFSFGSKLNLQIFYISQKYSSTALSTYSRDQLSSIIIMSGTNSDEIKKIFREKIRGDLTKQEQDELISKLNSSKFSFIMINSDLPFNKGRIRFNNQIIIPDKTKNIEDVMEQINKVEDEEDNEDDEQLNSTPIMSDDDIDQKYIGSRVRKAMLKDFNLNSIKIKELSGILKKHNINTRNKTFRQVFEEVRKNMV